VCRKKENVSTDGYFSIQNRIKKNRDLFDTAENSYWKIFLIKIIII